MAPLRLNQYLRQTYPAAVARQQQRRRQGLETLADARQRMSRLIATLADTADWSAQARALATTLFR